jgi:hypothetical protein
MKQFCEINPFSSFGLVLRRLRLMLLFTTSCRCKLNKVSEAAECFNRGGIMAVMSAATNEEYRVLVTHLPASEPNGSPWRWRATVLGFPDIAEEGASREQVIEQIQARLAETLRRSEIVTVTVSTLSSPATTEEDDALGMQGWDDHGLFKDDPEALKLFDEIEEERDRHLVGNE